MRKILNHLVLCCAKHKPLVSVIVASYNYEQYIEQTIRSIMMQSYRNIEILVVDDGSCDNSLDIIRRLEKEDCRVKLLLHEGGKNRGLPATVQMGVEKATGEYIAFCESDDFWHPEMLATKVCLLNRHPHACIISNNIKLVGLKESTSKLKPYIKLLHRRLHHNKGNKIDLEANFECNHIPTFSCVMIKADLLRGLDFNPTKPAWLDLWLYQQILKEHDLYYIPYELTYWRIHEGSFCYSDIGVGEGKEHFANNLRLILAERDSVREDFSWLSHRILRYNASFGTDNDRIKMEYTLLRENHVIEKGLSMESPREGFGVEKVATYLKRLEKYVMLYAKENPVFLDYPMSTIKDYLRYTRETSKVDISELEQKYHEILAKLPNSQPVNAGVTVVRANEIQTEAQKDFHALLHSRHSIRYFKQEQPSIDTLEKALALASRTPSACNRQAWKTHIYFGEDCGKLLRWQGGSRGLEDNIPCCIIVTADIKAFLEHEVYQAYVDGGLYAMNLINSLHYYGLGTIPLSLGFHGKQLEGLKDFNIPDNEVPIVIIGTGNMYENFRVAVSRRKDIKETNKYETICIS